MNSRERVLTAIERGIPDRIPLDIWATTEVWRKLQAHFATDDNAVIEQKLHIDGFAHVAPSYIGPEIPIHADGMTEDYWGIRRRPKEYAGGVYPDWFDYSTIRDQCEQNRDRAIMAGGCMPFFYHNLIRGLELSLIDLVAEPEMAHVIITRICDFFYGFYERMLDAAEGLIDVAHLTDDFGTQNGLMISPQMFDTFFDAHYRRLATLIKDHGAKIIHHDDGAMWELLPRLIDIGIDILNPIQYRCGNLDLDWLNDTYGDRLCFHGGVDNQQVLPFGSVEDVIAETRKCIESLGRGGGYILAPCHNLQAVSPVENIIAMYETAYNEGVY
jgi:uroporphyrinogen decarboxylase